MLMTKILKRNKKRIADKTCSHHKFLQLNKKHKITSTQFKEL